MSASSPYVVTFLGMGDRGVSPVTDAHPGVFRDRPSPRRLSGRGRGIQNVCIIMETNCTAPKPPTTRPMYQNQTCFTSADSETSRMAICR